jgi:hypothetical protein
MLGAMLHLWSTQTGYTPTLSCLADTTLKTSPAQHNMYSGWNLISFYVYCGRCTFASTITVPASACPDRHTRTTSASLQGPEVPHLHLHESMRTRSPTKVLPANPFSPTAGMLKGVPAVHSNPQKRTVATEAQQFPQTSSYGS